MTFIYRYFSASIAMNSVALRVESIFYFRTNDAVNHSTIRVESDSPFSRNIAMIQAAIRLESKSHFSANIAINHTAIRIEPNCLKSCYETHRNTRQATTPQHCCETNRSTCRGCSQTSTLKLVLTISNAQSVWSLVRNDGIVKLRPRSRGDSR